jgi:tetratricopeptide (TPR) repeat protein
MNFDPDRGFAEAMLALQAGKLGDAERLCNAVLRGEPKHVEALNLLGVVLGRLGRNAEAVASFDRALVAAPDSVDTQDIDTWRTCRSRFRSDVGQKRDIEACLRDVRFAPNSGHRNSFVECPLCAKSRHRAVQQSIALIGACTVGFSPVVGAAVRRVLASSTIRP